MTESLVCELTERDEAGAVSLWEAAGLVRPWNNPHGDFDRARGGATSAVLGVRDGGVVIGTVMVGHDGHRGWLYYVAVEATRRREGIGTRLVEAGQQWLRDRGAVKVQLMVRADNVSLVEFYGRLGYEVSDVTVLARWLADAS